MLFLPAKAHTQLVAGCHATNNRWGMLIIQESGVTGMHKTPDGFFGDKLPMKWFAGCFPTTAMDMLWIVFFYSA